MVQLCADKGKEEDFIEMAAAKSAQYRQKQGNKDQENVALLNDNIPESII